MKKLKKELYLKYLKTPNEIDYYAKLLTIKYKKLIPIKKINENQFSSSDYTLKSFIYKDRFEEILKTQFKIKFFNTDKKIINIKKFNYINKDYKNDYYILKYDKEWVILVITYFYNSLTETYEYDKIAGFECYYKNKSKSINNFYNRFNEINPLFINELNNNKIINSKIENIHLIVQEGNELKLKPFNLKNEKHNIPFNLLYNENIVKEYDKIVNNLLNNSKGIYILYGEPGTGKSSFLKTLIKEKKLNDKMIVYCPSNILASIDTVGLLSFLIGHKEKEFIFICEDSEKFLTSRDLGNGHASSFLNMSDGILNSAISIQFIFTHNTKRDHIDEAFKRPGRLQMEMEFDKIKYDTWKNIIDYIDSDIIIDKIEDKTLAEVFDLIEKNKNSEEYLLKKSNKSKIKIGFN